MRASILCPAMSSTELYSMMRSANLRSMAVFVLSCISSVASRKAVCSFVLMRVKSLHRNEYRPAGAVETDRTLSRKSPMMSGIRPFLVLESLSRLRLRSVRWFGCITLKRWLSVVLSVNVAQSILAAGGGLRAKGVVGPRASTGFGRLSSFAIFNASLRMFIAPTSPLRTAMMIR